MIGYPWTSILGAILVAAIIATTWWVPGMQPTILSGIPWLALISVGYLIHSRRRQKADLGQIGISNAVIQSSPAAVNEKR
jgi:L-asparagine transporter-like permease